MYAKVSYARNLWNFTNWCIYLITEWQFRKVAKTKTFDNIVSIYSVCTSVQLAFVVFCKFLSSFVFTLITGWKLMRQYKLFLGSCSVVTKTQWSLYSFSKWCIFLIAEYQLKINMHLWCFVNFHLVLSLYSSLGENLWDNTNYF